MLAQLLHMRNNRPCLVLSHTQYIVKQDLPSNSSTASSINVILLLYWYTAQT